MDVCDDAGFCGHADGIDNACLYLEQTFAGYACCCLIECLIGCHVGDLIDDYVESEATDGYSDRDPADSHSHAAHGSVRVAPATHGCDHAFYCIDAHLRPS